MIANKSYKYKKIKRKLFMLLIILLLIFSVVIFYVENNLSNIAAEMSENTVKAKAAIIINNSVYNAVEKYDITYDSLVTLEKDENGRIIALKSNVAEINKFKSKISVEILEELTKMNRSEIKIPFGSLTGSAFLSGKGPDIYVKVIPVGTFESEIINNITSAGINQSSHRIMLNISAELKIITPLSNITTSVSTNVCIAETVIVGEVPNSYMNINTRMN